MAAAEIFLFLFPLSIFSLQEKEKDLKHNSYFHPLAFSLSVRPCNNKVSSLLFFPHKSIAFGVQQTDERMHGEGLKKRRKASRIVQAISGHALGTNGYTFMLLLLEGWTFLLLVVMESKRNYLGILPPSSFFPSIFYYPFPFSPNSFQCWHEREKWCRG